MLSLVITLYCARNAICEKGDLMYGLHSLVFVTLAPIYLISIPRTALSFQQCKISFLWKLQGGTSKQLKLYPPQKLREKDHKATSCDGSIISSAVLLVQFSRYVILELRIAKLKILLSTYI